jgi:hypothetical protein
MPLVTTQEGAAIIGGPVDGGTVVDDRVVWTVITAPTNAAFLNGTATQPLTVAGLVRVDPIPIGSSFPVTVTVKIGSVSRTVTGNSVDGDFYWSTTAPVAQGQLVITASAIALGKQSPLARVEVTVHTTPPLVTINSPAPNDPVGVGELGGSLPVQVTATDNVGVASVEARVDGTGDWTRLSPDGSGRWNQAVPLSAGIPLGQHVITVRCTDRAGNTTAPAPVTITIVDNTPPAYEITAPPDGARILNNASIRFSGTVRDRQSGIKAVAWEIDGGALTRELARRIRTGG